MAVRKSKTAQRRERVSSSTQQRTIVLPLPLTREQYDPIRRSAEEYNRMWSSLISWCDSNKTVNRTRMQKENYRRLRDRHPTLPAQFACIAMRDAAGAMRSWNSNHPKRRWNMKASRKALTINYDMRVMSLRGNLLTLSVAHGGETGQAPAPRPAGMVHRAIPRGEAQRGEAPARRQARGHPHSAHLPNIRPAAACGRGRAWRGFGATQPLHGFEGR